MRVLSVYLAILVFLFSCQKSEETVDQGNYMNIELSAYHPDTSVFANININDVVLTNTQQFNKDEVFNIFLQRSATIFKDSALLDVLLVKSSGQSLIFKDSVRFNNINKFFLFQTCPNNTPILIDMQKGETSAPPVGDSVKVRFFFSSNDKIFNPNPGFNKLVKRMRLQIFTFTPSTNPNLPPPASSFVQVYGAIDFNECGLSDYFSLSKKKKYAFRIRDISPGVPSSSTANLVQQLLPDKDIQLVTNSVSGKTEWDFKRGKVFLDDITDAKDFQTLRIKKSIIPYQNINGDELRDTAYNGQFVYGLNR